MATSALDMEHAHGEAHHHELSFVQKYIFSTDHKTIGIQFLMVSLVFLLIGGILAVTLRWPLGFPDTPLPGGGILPETMAPGGYLLPEFYNSLVTMHGTFMIFFAVMPLLVGTFANYLIPLKIGAPDMAFPRLNMWSFWLFALAGVIMTAGFFVQGGHAGAGWTAYPPLSAKPEFSGVSTGQALWLLAIAVAGQIGRAHV